MCLFCMLSDILFILLGSGAHSVKCLPLPSSILKTTICNRNPTRRRWRVEYGYSYPLALDLTLRYLVVGQWKSSEQWLSYSSYLNSIQLILMTICTKESREQSTIRWSNRSTNRSTWGSNCLTCVQHVWGHCWSVECLAHPAPSQVVASCMHETRVGLRQ